MRCNRPSTNALFRVAASVVGLAILLPIRQPAPTLLAAEPDSRPAQDAEADHTPRIKEWFADLDSLDPTMRSEALVRLMGLKRSDLPELQKIVREQHALAPTQSTVLRQIVTQVYLAGTEYLSDARMGFLGVHVQSAAVTFGENPDTHQGMFVTDRMPGFVGARMLRDGDMIISILERPDAPLAMSRGFSTAVTSLGAGTVAHFQVLREGQIIWVPITLDARPLVDEHDISQMLTDRQMDADAYWDTHFATLVDDVPVGTPERAAKSE